MDVKWSFYETKPVLQYVRAFQVTADWFAPGRVPNPFVDSDTGFTCEILYNPPHIRFSYQNPNGTVTNSTAVVGGWVLCDQRGNFMAMTPEQFRQVYREWKVLENGRPNEINETEGALVSGEG